VGVSPPSQQTFLFMMILNFTSQKVTLPSLHAANLLGSLGLIAKE
jgi:hypothetical protein